jgi:predicted nucleotidyltransferase
VVADATAATSRRDASRLCDLPHLEAVLAELLGVEVDVVSAGALLDRDAEVRNDAITL